VREASAVLLNHNDSAYLRIGKQLNNPPYLTIKTTPFNIMTSFACAATRHEDMLILSIKTYVFIVHLIV
jgi:hypothetical protein